MFAISLEERCRPSWEVGIDRIRVGSTNAIPEPTSLVLATILVFSGPFIVRVFGFPFANEGEDNIDLDLIPEETWDQTLSSHPTMQSHRMNRAAAIAEILGIAEIRWYTGRQQDALRIWASLTRVYGRDVIPGWVAEVAE